MPGKGTNETSRPAGTEIKLTENRDPGLKTRNLKPGTRNYEQGTENHFKRQ